MCSSHKLAVTAEADQIQFDFGGNASSGWWCVPPLRGTYLMVSLCDVSSHHGHLPRTIRI